MSCATCGTAKTTPNNTVNISNSANKAAGEEITDCDYTTELLTIWLNKLKWFKDKGLYSKTKVTPTVLNKYIGIVLTSINIKNKCRFKHILDDAGKLITLINGLQNDQ